MTVREVAAALRISPFTLYRWAAKKVVPHLKVRGRTLFDEAELRAWLAARHVPPADEQADTEGRHDR